MKTTIYVSLALMILSANAMAQADLVKQKAKQIRDNNNQQQGIAAPAAPAPALAAPAVQVPTNTPTIAAGLALAPQNLLDRFVTDAVAIKAGAAATADQKQALATDLSALIKGSTKPAQATLTKLAGDFSTALSDKALANKDLAMISKYLNYILNSAPLTAARVQPLITGAQSVLKSAGITPATVEAVGGDLNLIFTQIQQNKPKLYQ